MKLDDRVRVINENTSNYGVCGTITIVNSRSVYVKLDNGQTNSYSRNSLEIVNVKENNDYNLRMMICEQFSDEPIWCIVDCDGEVVEEKLTLQKAKEHICDDIHVITCNLPIFGLKKVVEMI